MRAINIEVSEVLKTLDFSAQTDFPAQIDFFHGLLPPGRRVQAFSLYLTSDDLQLAYQCKSTTAQQAPPRDFLKASSIQSGARQTADSLWAQACRSEDLSGETSATCFACSVFWKTFLTVAGCRGD